MRREAMPERMRAELLLNAGASGGRTADVPHRFVGDGLFDAGIAHLAGEQIRRGASSNASTRAAKARIGSQEIGRFWLRRRSECPQCPSTRSRNTPRLSRFPGTA